MVQCNYSVLTLLQGLTLLQKPLQLGTCNGAACLQLGTCNGAVCLQCTYTVASTYTICKYSLEFMTIFVY